MEKKKIKDDELMEIYFHLRNQFDKLETLLVKAKRDENKMILIKMLQDSAELIQELISDVISYDITMENYNNPFLYPGHYYLYYSINKINMIIERIFNFLGIVYEIKFEGKIENNKIKIIWKKLKSSKLFNCKTSLNNNINIIMKDRYWSISKEFRKYNDHDLSIHLDDSKINELKMKKDVYKENFLEFINSYNLRNKTYDFGRTKKEAGELILNYKINKNFEKELVPAIKWMYKYLADLFDECIEIYDELVISKEKIYIEHKNLYLWNFDEKAVKENIEFNYKRYYLDCENVFKQSTELKEKIKERNLRINNNPMVVFNNPVIVKLEGYCVDSAFRLTECIRSFADMMNIMRNGKYEFLNLIDSNYFYYALILKLYSCYEKAGKVLYTFSTYSNKQSKNSKNQHFKDIGDININSKDIFYNSLTIAKQIIKKQEFTQYMMIRDKTYHGIREKYSLRNKELEACFENNIYILMECIKDVLWLLQDIDKSLSSFYEIICEKTI